jgi:hypothetical protein
MASKTATLTAIMTKKSFPILYLPQTSQRKAAGMVLR